MKIETKYKLSQACSADETRLPLLGAYIDGDKAIATDGRIMAIVPIERVENELNKKIIPAEILKAIEKSKLGVICLNGQATLIGSRGGEISYPYVDAQYPDYKRVLPAPTDCDKIALDAALLAKLAKAIGAHDDRRDQTIVILEISMETDADGKRKIDPLAHIGVTCARSPDARGLIMPARAS